MSACIDTTALEGLRANFLGELVSPDDSGYDQARRIWNGKVDRRPALIARCTGVADVMAAVRFARDRELPAAVRGGGHSVTGHALCDDGLVIDLSPMRGTRLDMLSLRETAYGANKWQRLVALRGKYDPTNFFRFNANIPPNGQGPRAYELGDHRCRA